MKVVGSGSGLHRYRHFVMHSRDRTLVNMQRHLTTTRVTKLGIVNARSIDNKHTQIVDEIISENWADERMGRE